MTNVKTLSGKQYIANTDLDNNFNAIIAGWVLLTEAVVSYISATQILITGEDVTDRLSVGMKCGITQSAVDKNFFVEAISVGGGNTTLTLDGRGSYTVANAAISNVLYSGLDNPYGWDLPDAILTKEIPIGDWNMNASGAGSEDVAVAHGITDYKKIRIDSVTIRDDSDVNYYDASWVSGSDGVGGFGVKNIQPTNINLRTWTGSNFDGATFSSTSYNRGWVNISYTL